MPTYSKSIPASPARIASTEVLKATVAERGQITIPKALRERLGLAPGTVIELHEENGRLVAEKVLQDDPFTELYGCFKGMLDRPTDELIREMREGI